MGPLDFFIASQIKKKKEKTQAALISRIQQAQDDANAALGPDLLAVLKGNRFFNPAPPHN